MYRILFAAAIFVGIIGNAVAEQAQSYRMPTYNDVVNPPPPRPKSDVDALLAGKDPTPTSEKPLKVLLVAGPKDHKLGEHDYPAWLDVWSRLLAKAPHTEVKTAWMFPTPEEAEKADVMVFYQKGLWNEKRAELIDQFLARGGGLVYIHWAVNGEDHPHEFAKRIGMASKAGAVGFRHGPLDIDFTPAGDHPVARNFDRVKWYDETYWRLRGDASKISLLGTSREDGDDTPQFWTYQPTDEGRVFVSVPGHYMWSFDDPAFRLLLMRGIAWSGHRNVDRFNNLVLLDARVE
ncbi:ThuA domain-containing protein [Aeoliella sp. ICT_H6.2]|uniref:ThuA domain-containing protein n=1 Tax=Aeoliella straminimaris TaxID=2954799 RepID=A0A9X2FDL2_9BACT|nr:ThuA domain-containing protein [Aeoliella straminimaris]MCO6042331.1 ThuA domain-containing protein [Aeoliella straminimaris]